MSAQPQHYQAHLRLVSKARFKHGPSIDEPLQLTSATAHLSYLQDPLGSTTQLIDANNAQPKARLDYKSYGKLEGNIPNPNPANPLTYTGREDDGTGLMYYRSRYYDPELEVFVSADPMGDAQRYVGGNPLRFKDPMGLCVPLPNPVSVGLCVN